MKRLTGTGRCPTYLYRWLLFTWKPYIGAYLHHFVGDDWSGDLHDHPRRFISIGLRGRYLEETPQGYCEYRAPWIRSFPASHIHRIILPKGRDCWTLVIVLKLSRPWGFWHQGTWMEWKEYVRGKYRHIADAMATCAGGNN